MIDERTNNREPSTQVDYVRKRREDDSHAEKSKRNSQMGTNDEEDEFKGGGLFNAALRFFAV